jgi:ammonium transporter Rh
MIFIGFGFLMVFLKTHCWTSVGFNFLIATFCIQITILWQGLWHQVLEGHKLKNINMTLENMIAGDFGAAAVLITFGGILGRCSVQQLFLIAFLEIPFYALNEAICVTKFKAVDMGGSMYVHTFGAYFGLACSLAGFSKAAKESKREAEGDRISNLTASIGTLFLWMYWPSFNGALAVGST